MNEPYYSVNKQQNNNSSVWAGMGIGAVSGLGLAGGGYGMTIHGAPHLQSLNQKLGMSHAIMAGNRMSKKIDAGKMTADQMNAKLGKLTNRYGAVHDGLSTAHAYGQKAFGSGKRALVTSGVGLLGGALAGGVVGALSD